MKLLVSALLFMAPLPLAAVADETSIQTPVELNHNADLYDGKYVSVRGFIVNEFENHGIWQAEDSKRSDAGQCVSILYSGKPITENLRKITGKKVVASGVFSKNIFADRNFVAMGSCNRTAVTVDKVEITK